MMRTAAALILFGALLVGCSDDDGVVEGPAAAEVADEAPYGAGVEVGQSYDYALYVHCGVEWARIDGAWWRTAPLDDGNANPPDGWGNPYDGGELTLTGAATAIYAGPDGPVEFERTERTDSPRARCE